MALQNRAEKRQFGRRTTSIHGWIKITGRQRIPCMVRNISARGALLEVEGARSLPYKFALSIEPINFNSECEIKHRGDHSVGVFFEDVLVQPETARFSTQDVLEWVPSNRR